MTKPLEISYKIAKKAQDFEDGATLFQQYANFIAIDLSFRDFAYELKTIHTQYNIPKGALLIAYNDTIAIGCVGIRELDIETAELKRMFVQEEYQEHKIGQKMLEMIIDIAENLNYKKIRLDTLSNMKGAIKLYLRYGFYEIASYRFNPNKDTIYMEKKII